MGASVFLYNRYDQLVREAFTDQTGKFVFAALAPDIYSIRVILASFNPAERRNIAVAAGSENRLRINLASVFSTVELAPASASKGTLMTDDWKWVLRTAQATRPVLRVLPGSSSSQRLSPAFSDTKGVVRVSAGDGDSVAGSTAQDLGTAFAVATVLNGSTHVSLSGNVGYMANSGLPTAGFRSTYSHDNYGEAGPQLALTAHQIYFPGLGVSANAPVNSNGLQGDGEGGPTLRIVSFSVLDKLDITDQLRLEYGSHLDSVSFLAHMNRLSPFGRATYDLGANGLLRVAFSAGTEPRELMAADSESHAPEVPYASDLNRDLTALSALPRISRSNGTMRMQRAENFEVGYRFVRGSRKYSAAVYYEAVTDGAFTLSASNGFLSSANLLPDLDSQNFIFDVGNYHRTGYTAAVTQALGDHAEITLAAGRGGALVSDTREAAADTASDVRGLIHPAQRTWATARASMTVPCSGTRIETSYGWTDFRSLMPVHYSLTENTNQDEGWNVRVRQPLPHVRYMHGRLEATAEMRNALAQGYLPLDAAGYRAVLTNSPRALRGGLSFLF